MFLSTELARMRNRTLKTILVLLTLAIATLLLVQRHDQGRLQSPAPGNSRQTHEPGYRIPLVNLCSSGKDPKLRLLVLITSAPGHRDQRDTIRSTWGTIGFRKDVALAFFLGQSLQQEVNDKILRESTGYSDIIQGNFVDSYNNLTLKTISMLEWTLTYCNQTRMLLKTDDDMFINFPKLFEILDKRFANTSNAIIGNVAKRWKPFRDPKSPYYLSTEQFPGKYLPDFNSGPAYIVTSDVIGALHSASLRQTFFRLEDVYITGMIASQLGVQHIHVKEFYNTRPKRITPCYAAKGVSIHMVRREEMRLLWTSLSTGQVDCLTNVRMKLKK